MPRPSPPQATSKVDPRSKHEAGGQEKFTACKYCQDDFLSSSFRENDILYYSLKYFLLINVREIFQRRTTVVSGVLRPTGR